MQKHIGLFYTAVSRGNDGEGFVFSILFSCLLIAGIADRVFGDALLTKLRKNDTLIGKIRLRKFGKIWLFCIEFIIFVLFCLSVYVQSITLAALFTVLILAHGAYMLSILSTRIEVTEKSLSCKTLFHRHVVDFSHIRSACWVSRGRSFGCTLVLKCDNGREISFQQIYFIGLNDLWARFNVEY